jgi:AcrR family transcriptional regulator
MVRTVKKPEERRLDIVNAARRLFQSKGYNETTMQDVIDDLGIAKGTVYYYFKSKEELLEAVVDLITDESVARMEQAVAETSGNALDKLRTLITTGNISADNPDIMEELHRPGNMEMHARSLAVAVLKQAPLYARLFEQGRAEGLFQSDAPLLETAEFILSAVQFLTDQGIYPWTDETLIRRAIAIPSIIEAMLKAPPGSFQFLLPKLSENGETKE